MLVSMLLPNQIKKLGLIFFRHRQGLPMYSQFTSFRFPSRTLTKQWALAWSCMVDWFPGAQQSNIKLNFPFPLCTKFLVYLYLSNLAYFFQSEGRDLYEARTASTSSILTTSESKSSDKRSIIFSQPSDVWSIIWLQVSICL